MVLTQRGRPPRSVRVLHLEDDANDSELVCATLTDDGVPFELRRVDTRDAFLQAISAWNADVILSDFSLPTFDGAAAVRIARERVPDIPFLFVSGTLGEDAAIEALRLGADDYVLKGRLNRLPAALRRAVEQADERRRLREAEARLQESEERFRRFMEAAPVAAWMRDASGRFVYANRRTQELAGRPDEGVLGRRLDEVLDTSAAADLERADREVMTADRSVDLEVTLRGGDGSDRRWTIVAFPLRDVSGRPLAGGIAVDVTERRRLEQRYLHAQKLEAVGRLAGGVAHDFNNLLTVIDGYAQLIEAGPRPQEQLRAWAGEIRAAGERAAGLTRQLLAFSRMEVVQPVVLDACAVVGAMDRMLARVVGEDVQFDLHVSGEPLAVRVDRGQFEQIVMNLVVNARDAVVSGGRIGLSVELASPERVARALPPGTTADPGAEYVAVSVRDDGVGMSAATRARLFEPFFTTKERGRGTGLGLATVHGIVQQNGGFISVTTALGSGTTFDIFLPRVEARTDGPPSESGPAELPRGSERLLVVEDTSSVRALVSRVLSQQGYRVIEAADGVQAMDVLDREEDGIDMLVTDLVMPRRNGPDLAELVRERIPGCPVVFLTGYADHATASRVVPGPTTALLRKPFTMHDILLTVRRLLDAPVPG